MQERLELIFNLFPLSPLHSPQVDHNIKECSPWQHNPGRNVGVWVSCGRDFTLNALICTNRINMISQWVTQTDSTLYLPSHCFYPVFIHFPPLSASQWQSRIKTGINLLPSHLIQLQNNAGRPLCPRFHWLLHTNSINVLKSHAISLYLCVTRDFLARHIEG